MNSYHLSNMNKFWLTFILIHILAAPVLAGIVVIPFGVIMVNTVLWISVAYMIRAYRYNLVAAGAGWSFTAFCLNNMPISFQASFLMNELLLLFILLLFQGNMTVLLEKNNIKKIDALEVLKIIILSLLFFIIGHFVNALSMLYFHNYVADSLYLLKDNCLTGLLVFAIMPAIAEELIFRGYVFYRVKDTRKAIILSAVLFALGHMNFNQITYAFVFGLFFAVIYYYTGNLTVTMITHCLFNSYTVITTAFSQSPIIKKIIKIQIGNYYMFQPKFIVNGEINMMIILIGGVIVLAALGVVFLILSSWKKKMKHGIEDWKPDISFYIGCVLCIIIALLNETS